MSRFLSLEFDSKQLAEVEFTLRNIRQGTARALTVAINKTVVRGKTRILRRIGATIALKRVVLNQYFSVKKANFTDMSGHIRISREPIPLHKFTHTILKRGGVSVKVRKDRPRERFPSTFEATMRSGHVGLFRRRHVLAPGHPPYRGGVIRYGQRSRRAWRLPIDERMGPTPLGLFEGSPGLEDNQIDLLNTDLAEQVDSQVDRLMERRKVA